MVEFSDLARRWLSVRDTPESSHGRGDAREYRLHCHVSRPIPSLQHKQDLVDFVASLRTGKATLPGADLIEPLSQGDYDGLCGLYCIINAIRLVLAPHRPLTDKEARSLFWTGIRYIDSHSNLSSAVRRAIARTSWPGLAERIRQHAQRLAGLQLTFAQPQAGQLYDQPDRALEAIETMIASKHAPMVFMRGKYRHYSVICGYTPKSLRLFDSFGYQWVRRASCGHETCANSLHRFHVASLIAVSAKP